MIDVGSRVRTLCGKEATVTHIVEEGIVHLHYDGEQLRGSVDNERVEVLTLLPDWKTRAEKAETELVEARRTIRVLVRIMSGAIDMALRATKESQ